MNAMLETIRVPTEIVVPSSVAALQKSSLPPIEDTADGGDDDHEQGGRRPGGGDAELGAGRGRLGAHVHQAAEEEQVDAGDLDPLAAGGERVAELVDDDRAEEQERLADGGEVERRALRGSVRSSNWPRAKKIARNRISNQP